MAKLEARIEIRKQITFLTFEEFLDRKREGSDFSLKLVGVSADTDLPVASMGNDLPAGDAAPEAAGGVEKGPELAALDANPDLAREAGVTAEEGAGPCSAEIPGTSDEVADAPKAQGPADEPPLPPESGPVILLPSEPATSEQPGSDPIEPNLA